MLGQVTVFDPVMPPNFIPQTTVSIMPYSTSDIVQSSMNALDNTIRVNSPSTLNQMLNVQKENDNNHFIKHVYLDEKINHTGQSTIFSHLARLLKTYYDKIYMQNGSQKVGMDVDLTQLALELGNLNSRMTKALVEIIKDYYISNPIIVKVMGKKTNLPYEGHYDHSNKSVAFDLKNFPDNLVIVMVEFIRQQKMNNK